LITTAVNEHDLNTVPNLMEGIEDEVYGDSGYTGIEKREENQHIN